MALPLRAALPQHRKGLITLDSLISASTTLDTVGERALPPAATHDLRRLATAAAARFHDIALDDSELGCAPGEVPTAAALVAWLRQSGLWATSVRLSFQQLTELDLASPIVLLLDGGGAALLVAKSKERKVVWVKDPLLSQRDPALAVDELRLAQVWSGETLLIRPERAANLEDRPFSLAWVAGLVAKERRAIRDVLLASMVLSILTVLPPLMVMAVVDQVITHQSMSTLILLSLLIGTALLSETLLAYARRQMILMVGARVDAKLNLHLFDRVLRLPLDYFERNQAGSIWSMTGLQINKIREFLTGKLLATMLDLVTLLTLLPVLFYLQPTLSWLVLIAAGLLAVVIALFMRPMGRRIRHWVDACAASWLIYGLRKTPWC